MGDASATSGNVDRLKQLLFDSETETLADLQRRIDALTAASGEAHTGLKQALTELKAAEAQSRDALAMRIDALMERVGNDAQLEASVAAVLDGALRKAEEIKCDLVSDAVAPFVVNTVRSEIRNSRDELVEALYPVTGRIVKAYVASAMKDLADQINRRLETNPIMLRLRSLATGRSVAELAIADTQPLKVEELYLIRRGTGELVSHWPASALGSNRDQVMSGVLAAINEFATEAFSADGTALRHIDLGADRVYLRDSPAYLLAAKCSGSAPVAVESVVDDAFLSTIDQLGAADRDGAVPDVLGELSTTLESRIAETQAEISGGRLGTSPLKVLAWLIGVPLVTWFAWTTFEDYRRTRIEQSAAQVIETSADVKGYPIRVSAGWLGRTVTVSGLVPTPETKTRVLDRLTAALPSVTLTDEVAVVPNALADVEPELERLRGKTAKLEPKIGEARSEIDDVRQAVGALEAKFARETHMKDMERAERLIQRAKASLAPVLPKLDGPQSARASAIGADFDRSLKDLSAAAKAVAATDGSSLPNEAASLLTQAADRTRKANRELSGLIAALPAAAPVQPGASGPLAQMVSEAEQIDMVAVALAQVVALKSALPPPPAPVLLPQPSGREKLEAWARANAIFFSTEAEFRDPGFVEKQIRELAELMKASDTVVRVVGYTDELGGSDRNSPLSEVRAAKVAAALRAAGVPAARIVTLGRAFSQDISANTGTGSPNRRVEFEIGFIGETAR